MFQGPREGQYGWSTVNEARLAQSEGISRARPCSADGPMAKMLEKQRSPCRVLCGVVAMLAPWLLSGQGLEMDLSEQDGFLHWSQ